VQEEIEKGYGEAVPLHLRNPVTPLMKGMGYGKEYKYPHSYPGHFVEEEYLPKSLQGRRFYVPGDQGFEKQIAARLRSWWLSKGRGNQDKKVEEE
jgi:putative ATPase